MASRPQNIGIKAIELYFPSQVCTCSRHRRSEIIPQTPSPGRPGEEQEKEKEKRRENSRRDQTRPDETRRDETGP